MVVPPLSEDITDENGVAKVNGYNVVVTDEKAPIANAFITISEDGRLSVKLPEANKIDIENRISVVVTDNEDKPVKGMTVVISETAAEGEEKAAVDVTDENGKATVPPTNIDVTDFNGYGEVDGYIVIVKNAVGAIEKVHITHNAEVKNEDGSVKSEENISVELPEGVKFDYANRIIVTVSNKADNTAVKDMSVIVSEKDVEVTLPVKSSGGGSSSGGGGGSRGNGGGGHISTNVTNITVTDKNGKNVSVSKSTDKDGKITLTLPNGADLTNDNYYTIKTSDSKGNAKADVSIILKDKKNNSANGTTDKNGMLILPASEHKAYIFGYADGTFRPDNNMSRAEAAAIFARLISEQKGEKTSGKSNFNDVSKNEWYYDYIGYLSKYGIIKGYSDNTFRPDDNVSRAEFVAMTVRFNSLFNDVKKGSYTVKYTDVATNYWAYSDVAYAKHAGWLNGYADGTFKGDNAITRAEVVTVVNRATGRKADESYITKNVSVLNKFTDIRNNSMWYYTDVMEAANTHLANSSNDTETWVK